MKKLLNVMVTAVLAIALAGFISCKSKPKDADIKAAIETALKADPLAANTLVSFENGVATVTGECKDEACKTHCAELVKGIKGVKEVINNITVAPAPVVINSGDELLTRSLADALKDIPSVTSAVRDGKIVLTGEIAKTKWVVLKQLLDKLKSKGYDLAGLKIK